MASGASATHRHFILDGFTQVEAYRAHAGGGSRESIPAHDRPTHAAILSDQLSDVRAIAEDVTHETSEPLAGLGLQVEFQSFPDIDLAFESLARESQGIQLRNVRHRDRTTCATVFVPTGKFEHFENLIRAYLERRTDTLGRPRDNQRLLDAIQSIRAAGVRALWTDDDDVFPESEAEQFLCEIWLPVDSAQETATSIFRKQAASLGIQVFPGELRFPERTVLLARTSLSTIQGSPATLNSIAELRYAKETADFFDSLTLPEQAEWLGDLMERTTFRSDSDAPHVCLLDTGVNRGHPLLAPVLHPEDSHTVEPAWTNSDDVGHGTRMAGLAIAGNLSRLLDSDQSIEIRHRLESVKLLRHQGDGGTDSRHHGHLTEEAVSRPETDHPYRRRVFSMAVTARDNRDRGRPTAWSAAVDALAADSFGQRATPRLIVVSAGNVADIAAWKGYPKTNDSYGIHDPAQAWNALTVGACTDLTRITEPDATDCQPIAPAGGLSPFSTTGSSWERPWPLKPDIVLEGGNAALNEFGASDMPSLQLLTTHHRPVQRLFTTANATSAASALASRMAAQIMAVYPELWPETVRALIVHSARWTAAMEQAYLPSYTKASYRGLVQRCGYGIPDLGRALWTTANSLTMVVQETLQPFHKESGKDASTYDMHLHGLPWPRDSLLSLGETSVELRVTLSYFIEPNPSRRGNSRYCYQSHGLRFDVRRPTEGPDDFRARINASADRPGTTGSSDPNWLLGPKNRTAGSLHSDLWRGTAADLASPAE